MDLSYYIPKDSSELLFRGTSIRIGGFHKIETHFDLLDLKYWVWIDPTLDTMGLLAAGGVYDKDMINLRSLDINEAGYLCFDEKKISVKVEKLNFNDMRYAYLVQMLAVMDRERMKSFEYMSEEQRKLAIPINRYNLLDLEEDI